MSIVEMAMVVSEPRGSRFTRGCAEAAFVAERTKRQNYTADVFFSPTKI